MTGVHFDENPAHLGLTNAHLRPPPPSPSQFERTVLPLCLSPLSASPLHAVLRVIGDPGVKEKRLVEETPRGGVKEMR